MDISLDSILQAVGLTNERQAQIAGQVTGNYEQMQKIGEQRALDTVAAGENDALVETQKQLGELQAQQNTRRFATAIGTNMDDNSELMTSLGMAYREKAAAAIAANQKVSERMSVSLMDDPVQYIVNQIMVGDDINRANQAQDEADQISHTMAKMNQDTQQTALTQNAIAQTKTSATAQAAADSVLLKAKAQAGAIKQQNLQFNVQSLETVAKLNEEQLSNLFNARSAVVNQKHLEIAQAQLEETKKMHEIALAERLDKLEQKKADLAEQEQMANTVRTGLSAMGYDGATVPTTKVLQYLKLKDPTYLEALKTGMTAETTGQGILGTNPGEAAITVATTKAPLAPGMKPVRDFMMQTSQAVVESGKDSKGMPLDPKNKPLLQATLSDALLAKAKQQQGNIKVGDPGNIYAPPDINSITRVVPGIMDGNFYKKVLQPQVATGMVDVDPNRITSLATAAVKGGQISYNDAVKGIAALYAGAAATNNVTRDYFRVGLPPQTGFNTTVNVRDTSAPMDVGFGSFDNSAKVNMVDTTQVGHLLSRQLSAGAGANTNLFPTLKRSDFAFGPKINFPR